MTRPTSTRWPTGTPRARTAVTTVVRSARTTPSGSTPGRRSRAEQRCRYPRPAPAAALAAAVGAGRLARRRVSRVAGRAVRRRLLAARRLHRADRPFLRDVELRDALQRG